MLSWSCACVNNVKKCFQTLYGVKVSNMTAAVFTAMSSLNQLFFFFFWFFFFGTRGKLDRNSMSWSRNVRGRCWLSTWSTWEVSRWNYLYESEKPKHHWFSWLLFWWKFPVVVVVSRFTRWNRTSVITVFTQRISHSISFCHIMFLSEHH